MDYISTPAARDGQHEMPFGTRIINAGVEFRLWAPDADAVMLKLLPDRLLPMSALPDGWCNLEVEGTGHGSRYQFVLPGGAEVPDPASRYQPDDVDGASEVVDPSLFKWSDAEWNGLPWEKAVIYEVHIGTFTPQGTFAAATERLEYLKELGITAVEIMPVSDFKGRWNWGYDGSLLFAPDASYGRPKDLKSFVDTAHNLGMMVFLDVVYNHFGHKGNYMPTYAPLMTDKHETPWGQGVNYDDDGSRHVRQFIIGNALYWLDEFHIDGLRFDAVHTIADDTPKHILQEMAEELRAATQGRHIHLICENAENQADWLKRGVEGRPELYTAQWSDDIHHLLHSAATGERSNYYADYSGRSDLLGRALAEGFAYQGEHLIYQDVDRGEPSTFLPPTAFVSYVQNHDQIGNRPLGRRLPQLATRQAARTLAAINLLSPHIPLLFMGEEWAAKSPFPYFSDLGDDLADEIRAMRMKELERIPVSGSEEPPDPMAKATFEKSKLDWDSMGDEDSARHLSLYRRLLALRHQEIVPRLVGAPGDASTYRVIGPMATEVTWRLGDGSELTLICNLSPEPVEGICVWESGHLWLEGFATGDTLDGFSAVFQLKKTSEGPSGG